MRLDLRPFGFTPTESLVYATLLRLGPSTGYAVARHARLARANVYAALEGLVEESAASRVPGPPPTRYRPTDPQALLAGLAARQGEALDHLARSLEGVTTSAEPVTHELAGARALGNVVSQLVARAERSVRGVIAAALWRPTLPAWRRAAGRATVDVRIAGDAPDDERLSRGSVASDTPTLLVVDEARAVLADVAHPDLGGLWSSHPLIVRVTAAALERLG
jgi:sugar-specific transcriptional regulator TrmB